LKKSGSVGFGKGASKRVWDISQQGAVPMGRAGKKVSFGLLFASTMGQSNKVKWYIADVGRLPASTQITSVAELDVIWFSRASSGADGFKGTLRDFLIHLAKKTDGQSSRMSKGKGSSSREEKRK